MTQVVKHVINGDQQNGWYCYQCQFATRDVELAAAADCSPIGRGATEQSAINDLTERLSERATQTTEGGK